MVQYTNGTYFATFDGTRLTGYSSPLVPNTQDVLTNWTVVADTRFLREGYVDANATFKVYNALITAGYTPQQAASISGYVSA